MKTLFKYIYIITLICVLCSCERDELNVSGNGSERTIEIVTRIPGFNNVDVKAAADADRPFETAIYTAYLFIFDENGDIVGNYYNLSNGSLYKSLTLKGLNKITACIVANVQESVISNIDRVDDLNSIVLELDYADYSESGYLGVPKLGNNLCFPMFGSITQDISSSSRIQIPLARLFAKITVNMSMNLGSNILDIQRNTYFNLMSYNICNLPTKVSLVNTNDSDTNDSDTNDSDTNGSDTNDSDWMSEWANVDTAFVPDNLENTGKLNVQGINQKIYNQGALGFSSEKTFTFDIYVPEYSVLPNKYHESFGDPKYKPNVYTEGCYPVYLQINGTYTPVRGTPNNVSYDIYLGEDHNTSFTLRRNIQYQNNITITGISNHKNALEVDHRVTITPADFVNMFGEVANCYVISATGAYTFPAYKGAFNAKELKPEYMCTTGTWVDTVGRTNDKVTFKNLGTEDSPNIFTLSTDNNGALLIGFEIEKIEEDSNVIIALKDDDGNIEWSWHLWFVEGGTFQGINLGIGNITTQTMPDGAEMMDRNLGAEYSFLGDLSVAGAVPGLYYQYGCKEPYISNGYKGGGESSDYVWYEDAKSPTDPCPPGYRVPSSDVWGSDKATNKDGSLDLSIYKFNAFLHWDGGTPLNLSNILNVDITDDIYLPYAGHLDSNKKLVERLSDETVKKSGEKQEQTTYKAGLLSYDVRNIKWHVDINRDYYGSLLAADKKTFTFQATSNSYITSQKVEIDAFEVKLAIIGWQKVNLASGNTLSNTIKKIVNSILGIMREDIENELDLTKDYYVTEFPDSDSDYGYQVRCVKE